MRQHWCSTCQGFTDFIVLNKTGLCSKCGSVQIIKSEWEGQVANTIMNKHRGSYKTFMNTEHFIATCKKIMEYGEKVEQN